MSIAIVVPVLGESITEATVAKWYKHPGDVIKIDELIVEIETDKVTLEVNAVVAGVLESIQQPENAKVKVGQVLGMIQAQTAKQDHTNADNDHNNGKNVQLRTSAQDNQHQEETSHSKSNKKSFMPPSVQKLIKENNLDLSNIVGTGKDGRVNKGDILDILAKQRSLDSTLLPASQGKGSVAPKDNPKDNPKDHLIDKEHSIVYATQHKIEERVSMSTVRRTIADRLKAAQNTAAILSTFNEIDMSALYALRTKYTALFQEKYNIKLGIMSFFIRAVIDTLKEIPILNAEINDAEIIYKYYYNIGIAVATAQGLVVPIIRNADQMSHADIEQEIVSLAGKARSGDMKISDLTEGTFTITNGGIYGSLFSTPIINPPQVAILGLHNIQERAVVIDGKVEVRPMMYVVLSYDHRIIDGKEAATFLTRVKERIQEPERLWLNI